MDQTAADLLTKERRRQRMTVASVVLGLGLVIISSRSERAMFQFGVGSPGVFAALREGGPAMPRVALKEGSPAAFFAGLGRLGKPTEPGNGRVIPTESIEQVGPQDALLFAGPESQLPPGNGFLSDPLQTDIAGPPGSIPPPGSGDPGSRRIISKNSDPGSKDGPDGPDSPGPGPDGSDHPNPNPGPGGTDSPATPSAVPEPATWVLMIGGFLGIGAMMRAQRRQGKARLAPSR